MGMFSFMIIVAYVLVPVLKISAANLTVSQSIIDGETLVSNSGQFELGFFTPGKSTKRYLGIWYKIIPVQRVVWVPNGANPINDSSGILAFSKTWNLEVRQNDTVVWSATYQKQARNPEAVLLDNGNFVIRNEGETNPDEYLWQSFDYPSDTLLPGMKLGWDLRTGLERRITSWKSSDDPSPGDHSWGLKLNNYPEFYLMNGTRKSSRIGPWNGLYFSGVSQQKPNPFYEFKYVVKNDLKYAPNKVEMSYSFVPKNSSVLVAITIGEGQFETRRWGETMERWGVFESTPKDACDTYGYCGAYGNCWITVSPVCQCLEGFSPKSTQEWNVMNWTEGCIRKKPLSCKEYYKDEFVKYVGLKVPDTTHTWVDESIDLDDCRRRCLSNCSCMAFTNSDIRGAGSGCVMWFGDLIDIRHFETGGQDLYIRMSSANSGTLISLLNTSIPSFFFLRKMQVPFHHTVFFGKCKISPQTLGLNNDTNV